MNEVFVDCARSMYDALQWAALPASVQMHGTHTGNSGVDKEGSPPDQKGG